MPHSILLGARVPDVKLASLRGGEIVPIAAPDLFAGAKSVVLGVPGAFTPVCSDAHVPDFVRNADTLSRAGFSQLVCIAASDPYAVDAWRTRVDPLAKLRFFSDGNLDFCRALGLASAQRELFLGERSERYMLVVEDQIITRVRVETSILRFNCTNAEDVLLAA